eukprot:m.333407 g.333407  ORF g.333407 m.333407 type:complete len:53 (+) comp16063_c1_seq7:2902-3060(+)
MMARSKVFSRYIPAVIENEVDLEVIEIYTPLQLTELLVRHSILLCCASLFAL